MFSLHADTLIIPQIADGGGWTTTIVLTNTSASPATVTLTFHRNNGDGSTAIWVPSFREVRSTEGLSIEGGGTLFLRSQGTSATTLLGWAEVQAVSSVQAYAIFSSSTNQQGTAVASGVTSRVLVPFDNTSGNTTSVALANPGGDAQIVAANIRTLGGALIGTTAGTLPALGHMAFSVPAKFPATAGQQGMIEFIGAAGTLSAIALRFNSSGSFSSVPVYGQSGASVLNVPNAPTQIAALAFPVSTIPSGGTTQGTVYLSAAAPTGGAAVALTTNSTVITIPSLVTVPEGATSASFMVTSNPLLGDRTATVTAQYAGNSVQAKLVLTGTVPGTAVSFTNLTSRLSFQPAGYDPADLTFASFPDSGNQSLTGRLVGTNVVLNFKGLSSDGTSAFAYSQLNGSLNHFLINGVTYTVSSASLLFTLEAGAASGSGKLNGTLTMTGRASGSKTDVTVSGTVSGTYAMSY